QGSLPSNPYQCVVLDCFPPFQYFILSNETVNIRSHLLGLLLFFLLGVKDMSTVLPASGANKEDYAISCIGRFCFQVCMLCSVGYHLFSCPLSEKKCCHGTTLEPWLFCSRGLPIFYPPSALKFWRQVYLMIVIALILAMFLAQIHSHYPKEWRHQRTAILGSVAGYGVIPAVHWVWLNGSFSSAVTSVYLMNFRHNQPCLIDWPSQQPSCHRLYCSHSMQTRLQLNL
uniref:Progestin and adipoQ receptor family member IIIb n=1 Tax=Oncorhynchus kisutch TaxID=8019 RepID=A0A8C7IZL4_ONCKI